MKKKPNEDSIDNAHETSEITKENTSHIQDTYEDVIQDSTNEEFDENNSIIEQEKTNEIIQNQNESMSSEEVEYIEETNEKPALESLEKNNIDIESDEVDFKENISEETPYDTSTKNKDSNEDVMNKDDMDYSQELNEDFGEEQNSETNEKIAEFDDETIDSNKVNTDTEITNEDTQEVNENDNIDDNLSSDEKENIVDISASEPTSISAFSAKDNVKLQTLSTNSNNTVHYAARIKNGENSGRFSPISSNNSKALGWLENRTLFVTGESTYQGEKYYRIHSGYDGPMQGWVKEKDLRLFNISQPKKHNKTYDIRLEGHHLTTDPWGTATQNIKKLNQYNDAPFKAEQSLTLGAHTYYYGKIGNDYGWLEQSRLVDTSNNPFYMKNYLSAVKIKDGNNSGRYSPVTSKNSKSIGNWLKDRTLFATEKAKYQGTTFYKVHSGYDAPMQGWIKSEDLRFYNTSAPVTHKQDYAIKQVNHHLLTDPWGTKKQQIKRLGAYGNNAVFKAEQSMKLGNHTYYYGKIGNNYGWVEKSRVKDIPKPPVNKPQTKVVKYNQSLNNVLNTQMNLGAKPQAWNGNGGWRNATRNEVRQFLDTSNHKGGAWDYTFLNLDQSQGIAASTLNNNVLGNRGILTNQGNAFSQASKAHGVNEVYLISHAILETGHGQSQLAQGVRLDNNGNISNNGKKYYNMYGIGAVDHNAVLGGARYAQQMGWDTPAKAIVGGAQFVSQNYFGRGQNTLYSMRWNPNNPGTYQYATDVNWAYATANNLKNYYDQLGIKGRFFTRHEF